MKAYQLKFLAWTFSAFLPPPSGDPDAVDFYAALGVERAASAEEMKRAYRRRARELHPDKLRQRGMRDRGEVVSEEEARARFQKMRAAYDVLGDPRKREAYDALGPQGIDFVINPSHAWDPHVLFGNLAKSPVLDRAKLMALALLFFGLVLLQPILVCAKVNQMLEKRGGALQEGSWVAVLIPFWLFAVLYGVLLIIGKAVLLFLQWSCLVIGILFLALKFEGIVAWDYAIIFIPFYSWMILRVVGACVEMAAVRADQSKMATTEYIEKYYLNETVQDEEGNDIENQQLHRSYADLNEEEKDEINKKFIIVHVPPAIEDDEEEDDLAKIERSPEYQEAKARYDFASKEMQRVIIPELPLVILIVFSLDTNKTWNWGLTFLPLWISLFFDCCGGCYGFFCTSALAHIEVQEAMEERLARELESREQKAKEMGDRTPEPEDAVCDATSTSAVEEQKEPDAEGVAVSATATAAATAAKTESGTASDAEDKAVIATAISVKTEATAVKSEGSNPQIDADNEGDPGIEVTVPDEEGEGDDGDVEFEMDEDTYQFYQQAEQEADNKATEAQAKAIGSFCNIIFQTIVVALFVAKLNQVQEEQGAPPADETDSFSAFWILFPFLLVAGCFICCFACAIFGADGIDAVMSPDEAGDDQDASGDDEEAAPAGNETPAARTSPEEEGDAMEKNEDASTAQISESANDAGNGVAKAADANQENAMDDLD